MLKYRWGYCTMIIQYTPAQWFSNSKIYGIQHCCLSLNIVLCCVVTKLNGLHALRMRGCCGGEKIWSWYVKALIGGTLAKVVTRSNPDMCIRQACKLAVQDSSRESCYHSTAVLYLCALHICQIGDGSKIWSIRWHRWWRGTIHIL